MANQSLQMIVDQRYFDRPIIEGALPNAHAQLVRDQWVRTGHKDVVKLTPSLPADDENILKTCGCQKGRPRAFALEQSVRRDSGSVDDFRNG